ncbi:hypothetical protein AB0L63_07155 [Nocardia sp. NPDC051990]|uniref:hypothetical protein n=1 Tax=Nocardia sp. NPDC051990 TaxID=3155285 RepID=UPI003421ECBB
MREGTIVTPPRVCADADVELAHEQMRVHRACRIGLCVWKAAAYYTLIGAGRLAPQSLTPRERAAARGLEFPVLEREVCAEGGPTAQTLREVLDKLAELGLPVPSTGVDSDDV